MLSDAGRDGVRLHQEEGVGDTGVEDILDTDNITVISHCSLHCWFLFLLSLLCFVFRTGVALKQETKFTIIVKQHQATLHCTVGDNRGLG